MLLTPDHNCARNVSPEPQSLTRPTSFLSTNTEGYWHRNGEAVVKADMAEWYRRATEEHIPLYVEACLGIDAPAPPSPPAPGPDPAPAPAPASDSGAVSGQA